MFRWIGLGLLVMCACALLQGATLFAGITNGTFNDPDPGHTWSYGWTTDGDVYEGAGYGRLNSALIPESEGLTNSLSQIFSIAPNESSLRFDLVFEFGEFTETDYFKAFLLKSDGSPIDGLSVNPDGSFYWMNTKSLERELFPSNVTVSNPVDLFPDPADGIFRLFRSISIPISSDWGDAMIRFELVGEEELDPEINVLAAAFVSNVSTTVPEPATMALGLIGVAMVGAVRRKIRSTQS